jgi:L-threonylcarbamoyladenylate synthase
VKCQAARPDNQVIDEIVETLTRGAAVVMPTETQYALAMRADDNDTPEKIGKIKHRPEGVRAALFVKDIKMAGRFCHLSETAEKLAKRFLPGPLTLVMPGRDGQKDVAEGFRSEYGFGIRISSSPIIMAVMDKVPFTVTATSANISGATTPAAIASITEQLAGAVRLYVDGGPCRGIVPSTVIAINGDLEVLRHGLIAETELRRFLEEPN